MAVKDFKAPLTAKLKGLSAAAVSGHIVLHTHTHTHTHTPPPHTPTHHHTHAHTHHHHKVMRVVEVLGQGGPLLPSQTVSAIKGLLLTVGPVHAVLNRDTHTHSHTHRLCPSQAHTRSEEPRVGRE